MQIGSTSLVLVDVEAKAAISSVVEQCDVVAPEIQNLAATVSKLKGAVPDDQAATHKLHVMLDQLESQLVSAAEGIAKGADTLQVFLGKVLVDDQRVAYIVRPAA